MMKALMIASSTAHFKGYNEETGEVEARHRLVGQDSEDTMVDFLS
jgi:hypothetical protein